MAWLMSCVGLPSCSSNTTSSGGASGAGGSGGSSVPAGGTGGTDGQSRAGAAGSAGGGTLEPQLGASCAPAGTLACQGSHQKLKLICGAEGSWEANGTCGQGEFCSSVVGVDRGTCLTEVIECAGELPGALVCKDDELRRCGVDSLNSLLVEQCGTGCSDGACRDGCGSPSLADCDGERRRRLSFPFPSARA